MISDPARKYRRFEPIQLPDRQWPNRVLDAPPIWMSTDLRDGNQALIDPMSVETKLRFFRALVDIGFKEIEVGFQSASDTDFNFVRRLIEDDLIPEDVTIEVLTQARRELIERTVESLKGARRAILHMYNPVAPTFRKIVYKTDKEGVKNIAIQGTQWVKELTATQPDTEWVYQYSPEVFSSTEVEFAKEVCDAVAEVWQPTPENKIIFNLPATVEMSTPNTYADQIEWMHRNLNNRDSIILSVHPHNDRGTAVAAAELAVMAGADRVEGCLFGNGERTGNVDLVTLALNLYTQGIHPGLDFSDIDTVRRCVEYCNQLPVHPRHPYVGDLVFTAFSGSHQDAIKKGFAIQKEDAPWEVPYLPIDPADLGRNYDAVIRVNSQSGKGGVSYLLEQEHGLVLPRRLQIEFSRAIQRVTDETGTEATADNVYSIFETEYLKQNSPWRLIRHSISGERGNGKSEQFHIEVELEHNGETTLLSGTGNGAIAAFVDALDLDITIMDYTEHAIGTGTNTRAASYVEMRVGDSPTGFGVGIHKDIVTSSFIAILSSLNRHEKAGHAAKNDSAAA